MLPLFPGLTVQELATIILHGLSSENEDAKLQIELMDLCGSDMCEEIAAFLRHRTDLVTSYKVSCLFFLLFVFKLKKYKALLSCVLKNHVSLTSCIDYKKFFSRKATLRLELSGSQQGLSPAARRHQRAPMCNRHHCHPPLRQRRIPCYLLWKIRQAHSVLLNISPNMTWKLWQVRRTVLLRQTIIPHRIQTTTQQPR